MKALGKVKNELRVLVKFVIDFGFEQIVRYGLTLEGTSCWFGNKCPEST